MCSRDGVHYAVLVVALCAWWLLSRGEAWSIWFHSIMKFTDSFVVAGFLVSGAVLLAVIFSPFFVFADYDIESTTDVSAISTWGGTAERTAIRFVTTGAGTVESVHWCGRTGSGTPTGVAVSIWTDSASAPGVVVATSTTRGGFSGTAQRMEYTFATPVALDASTNYWVGFNLASLSGGEVQNCGSGSAGAQPDKYSSNSGGSWSTAQAWEQNFLMTVYEEVASSTSSTSTVPTQLLNVRTTEVVTFSLMLALGVYTVLRIFRLVAGG